MKFLLALSCALVAMALVETRPQDAGLVDELVRSQPPSAVCGPPSSALKDYILHCHDNSLQPRFVKSTRTQKRKFSGVGDFFSNLGEELSDVGGVIRDGASDVGSSISESSFGQTVQNIPGTVSSGVSSGFDTVSSGVSSGFDTVSSGVSSGFETVSSGVSSAAGSVRDTAGNTFETVNNSDFANGVRDTADDGRDAVGGFFSNVGDFISGK